MKPLEQHVQDVLKMTGDIIDTCGPRPAGSALCKKAARLLYGVLGKYCDEVHIDEFKHQPRAFLGHIMVDAILLIAAAILAFFGLVYPAIALFVLGHLVNVLEFGYYREFIDFMFKTKTGHNVIGTIEPTGEARQQVLITAHHDSAYEFRFLEMFPRLYFLTIFVSNASNWIMLIALTAWVFARDFFGLTLFPYVWVQYTAPFLILLDIPFLFFLRKEATPGAGDNLVSACILLKMSELLHTRKKSQGFPKNTRIILVSFDAEEAGLRGSRNYARKYKKHLSKLPTCNINLESLFDLKKLEYLVSDINGTVKLSQKLAITLQEISAKLGYKSRLLHMHTGYGATDAAELAKIGVQATTLAGLSTSVTSGEVVYHTHDDDVEHLDPNLIKATIEILSAFIEKKEQDVNTSGTGDQ